MSRPVIWIEIDLHGQPLEAGRIAYLIGERWRAAARAHAGLRIVHGRGAGAMAGLVGELLRMRGLEAAPAWRNPGETRVPAGVVQRRAWSATRP